MEKDTWKALAIIFIFLFVLESIILVCAWNSGTQMIENENTCSMNICGNDRYDAYFYDDYDEICYCYTNNEITYSEYLR